MRNRGDEYLMIDSSIVATGQKWCASLSGKRAF